MQNVEGNAHAVLLQNVEVNAAVIDVREGSYGI